MVKTTKEVRLLTVHNVSKSWTNEQFIESFLKNEVKVPNLTQYPDRTVKAFESNGC